MCVTLVFVEVKAGQCLIREILMLVRYDLQYQFWKFSIGHASPCCEPCGKEGGCCSRSSEKKLPLKLGMKQLLLKTYCDAEITVAHVVTELMSAIVSLVGLLRWWV